MKKPYMYQLIDGKKIDVAGEFTLLAKQEIGFAINDYDRSQQLVIDPILGYSTYLGGSATDEGFGITVDSSNNVYVTGRTSSTNFPTSSGAFQTVRSNPSFVGIVWVKLCTAHPMHIGTICPGNTI